MTFNCLLLIETAIVGKRDDIDDSVKNGYCFYLL